MDIAIQVQDPRWKKAVRTYRKTVHDACEAALAACRVKKGELCVVLADNAFVRDLNHTYRGKNKPTNVLSFPGDGEVLGDIVLALETIEAEAAKQDKILRHHMMHLLVHGTLHLLGYDHEKESDAAAMEKLEIKILEKLNVSNPYLS